MGGGGGGNSRRSICINKMEIKIITDCIIV